MKQNNKNTNVNSFNGQVTFNGATQIATGDIINNMYANEGDYKMLPTEQSLCGVVPSHWVY